MTSDQAIDVTVRLETARNALRSAIEHIPADPEDALARELLLAAGLQIESAQLLVARALRSVGAGV